MKINKIPVLTLYDEYIDRRNLSEQKNPFEYIVPPPSRGVGTKMICEGFFSEDAVSVLRFSDFRCSNGRLYC